MFSAVVAHGQFDVSQVVDFTIQIDPSVESVEMSPYPLVLGEVVAPRVTATLQDGTTGVAVPVGAYSFGSLDTNIVATTPDGRWVAVGFGQVSIGTYIGLIPRWRQIKVVPPPARLSHRYSFDPNANPGLVLDSIGNAHGWLTNQSNGGAVPLLSDGKACFDGTGGYVALPAGILSTQASFSFAVWVTTNGNTNFRTASHLLDFAMLDTNAIPGRAGGLALDLDGPALRAFWGNMIKESAAFGSFQTGDQNNNRTGLLAGVVAPMPVNRFGFVSFYEPNTSSGLSPLNMLVDTDNRIGGSLGAGLPFNGCLDEVRFYEGVLTSYDFKLMRKTGSDALAPLVGELCRVRALFDPGMLEFGNTQYATVRVFGDFTGATNVDLLATGFATLGTSGQLTLTGSNQVRLAGLGEAWVAVYATPFGSFLANISVPIAPPQQLRIVLSPAATNISVRDLPPTFAVRADFNLVPDVDVTSNSLTSVSLSDANVLKLLPGSRLAPVLAGRSTLTARLLSATTSETLVVTNPPGFAAAWPRLVHRWEFNGVPGMRDATNSISGLTAYGRQMYELLGGPPYSRPYGSPVQFTGTRVLLDGVGSYLVMYSSPFEGLSNGTIEAWVDCVNPGYEHLFSAFTPEIPYVSDAFHGQSFGVTGYVAFSMTGTAAFKPAGLGTNQHYEMHLPGPFPNHVLTHFAWVHSPSLGVAELYINGVRADTTPTSAPLSAGAGAYTWLGRNSLAPDQIFHGYLYEFRVYDGALTPYQIMRNRDLGSTVVSFNDVVLTHSFRPQLTTDGQKLKLHIPNPRSGFVLESSPTLGTTAIWTPVQTTTQIEPDETVSAEVPLESAGFFRLHLQP